MKRILVLFVLLYGIPLVVKAEWAFVPLEDLVAESDLIVVGTLREVKENSHDGVDYGEGVIEVHEVLWGDATRERQLTLKWQNYSDAVCPRVEHRGSQDRKQIWLLTKDKDGSVNADYPHCSLDLGSRTTVEAILSRGIYLFGGDFQPGEKVALTVIYRNASNSDRNFPRIRVQDEHLYLPQGTNLKVWTYTDSDKKYILPIDSSRLVFDKEFSTFVVPPQSEVKFKFDLSPLFKQPFAYHQGYTISLTLAGIKAANEAGIYIRETDPEPLKKPDESQPPFKSGEIAHGNPVAVNSHFNGYGLARAFVTLVLMLCAFRKFYR